jgi:UDP-2,3-diacylglucosamine hydrolase
MKRLYFLSDVHFGIGTPEVEATKLRRFLALTREIADQGEHLIIAGDLFDFWFEYRSVVPRGSHAILAALEALTSRGVAITYVVGNHDFAAGNVFRRDLGVQVHTTDIELECEGRRIAVHHGDGLAQHDGGYRLLKRLIRSRVALCGFRILHPDLGFGIARLFSRSSRDYTSTKFYGESDGMRDDARRRIEAGAHVVVMGHRHRPVLERIGNGTYVNLGDWLSHFTYGVYEHGAMTLWTLRHDLPEAWEG